MVRPGLECWEALLTLPSKGRLVIPVRLRQLLGLKPGDHLELSLEADGLLLKPHGICCSHGGRSRTTASTLAQ